MTRLVVLMFFLLGWGIAGAQQASKVLIAVGRQVQVQLVSPGSWDCSGGQTTTTGPPFCSPGTKKVFFWNMSSRYQQQEIAGSAADYVKGENITVVHGDFDGSYFGHMWGTFMWNVPEMGGRWEGTFTATADQAKGIVINRAVGYGAEGKLEGLKLEFFGANPGGGAPAAFIAVVTTK